MGIILREQSILQQFLGGSRVELEVLIGDKPFIMGG
jgi:hypothetical protein